MDASQTWYLMKHYDGTIFGPIEFTQLRQWALDAQISPFDKVSTDESTWVKAPMVPELEMDYIIEVSPDQYYGPTTLGAVKDFLESGEINRETIVTDCKDGTEQAVKDIKELQAAPEAIQPVRTNLRLSLQQRIRDLEQSLLEERRGRESAEQLVHKLEARLAELSSKAALL
ncbi:MAG: DUF4339 domain-containing protein [Verrucomicrobiota bacterium]|nr:DUF4339 domain-containing protein [Verrucomicrobiota bacterium]